MAVWMKDGLINDLTEILKEDSMSEVIGVPHGLIGEPREHHGSLTLKHQPIRAQTSVSAFELYRANGGDIAGDRINLSKIRIYETLAHERHHCNVCPKIHLTITKHQNVSTEETVFITEAGCREHVCVKGYNLASEKVAKAEEKIQPDEFGSW
jgi:hypothetical protein